MQAREQEPIAVTGANGALGRALCARALAEHRSLRAIVRSKRAETMLRAANLAPSSLLEIRRVDFNDPADLAAALRDCSGVIHLVGILKETAAMRYTDAHEIACSALARAAEKARCERIVYVSLFGADPAATNICLASKGRAEQILLQCCTPVAVLRVPIVLSPTFTAAHRLRRCARARSVPLIDGGKTREQPLDADDLIAALFAALHLPRDKNTVLELGGPESLTRRDLVLRCAALRGGAPHILNIPGAWARAAARVAEHVFANPPITRPMLEILGRDADVDPNPACHALDMKLTPLDTTLRRCLCLEKQTL